MRGGATWMGRGDAMKRREERGKMAIGGKGMGARGYQRRRHNTGYITRDHARRAFRESVCEGVRGGTREYAGQ